MINPIPTSDTSSSKAAEFERIAMIRSGEKRRAAKGFLNNAGVVVSVLMCFIIVILSTTNIKLLSLQEFFALGIDFFLFLFVAYSVFINCTDSGMRLGLQSERYCYGIADFEKLKAYIIDNKLQSRLGEFCCHYVYTELKTARTSILAVVGISYEDYEEKYIGKDRGTVWSDTNLSKAQKKAVVRANKMEPITLTPEMFMKRGRGSRRRGPLGQSPETKKGIKFGSKFVTTLLLSVIMSIIVFEMSDAPLWVIIYTCTFKLLTVAGNGFNGYRYGHENIVVDTVDYMSDQTDLMKQAVQYFENEKKDSEESVEKTKNA